MPSRFRYGRAVDFREVAALGSRTRLAATLAIGAAIGVVATLATVAGLGYTFSPTGIGQAVIGSVWANYTYTTSTPLNDSQPLNEMFQNFVIGGPSAGGAPGSQFGFTMSPYDNSTVNCTLWSVSVFAPFTLESVRVTDLPEGGPIVNEPLPVTLPAAVSGTSHWANLWIVVVLPSHSGVFALTMLGTASCNGLP